MCPLPFDLHELMVKQLDEPIDRLRVVQVLGYDKMEKTTSERQLFDAIQKAAEAAELLGFYEYDTKDSTGFRARQRVSDIEKWSWVWDGLEKLGAFWLLVTNGHFAKLNNLRLDGLHPETHIRATPFFDAVASGSMANLKGLSLYDNQIGDAGMKAFSNAIASGSLANLERLDLDSNEIGDAGMVALAGAMGLLANLQELWLYENRIGDKGMAAFSAAIASGSLANLQTLWLSGNKIGDVGMAAFANAITASGSLASLKDLVLFDNQISDPGMIAFAEALKPTDKSPMGSLANLAYLNLEMNKIGDSGMIALSEAIGKGSLRSLAVLVVNDGPLGVGHPQLKAACGKRSITLR